MGMLLFFAVGYVMGTRADGESLDDVLDAARAIRKSDEFHDFVGAVRTHAAHSLRGLATVVERGRGPEGNSGVPTDLLERMRLIVGRQ